MDRQGWQNGGVLFLNKKRGDNGKAPTMKGTGRITIDGREYELDLAAWTRESERAGKFLGLSIKLKGDYQYAAQPRADEGIPDPDFMR